MEYKKIDVDGIDKWDIYLREDIKIDSQKKKIFDWINYEMRPQLILAMLGDASFYMKRLEDNIDIEEVLAEATKRIKEPLSFPYDFEVSGEKEYGGILTMADGSFFEAITSDEFLEKEDGSVEMACAIKHRSMLMSDCEKGEVIGYLVPKDYEKRQ